MSALTIGCFDSGVGGLTVLKTLTQAYPQHNYIYYGDTANAPYGDKSKAELHDCNERILNTLLGKQVDAIVFACNTSISLFYEEWQHRVPVPTFEIVTPGCKAALEATKNKHIGVIATTRTCESKLYENTLKKLDSSITVTQLPAPQLVPIIESGHIQNPEHLNTLLAPIKELEKASVDTIIYGCSHYPFLHDLWSHHAPHIQFVDPAKHLRLDLEADTTNSQHTSKTEFIISGPDKQFRKVAESLFQPKTIQI